VSIGSIIVGKKVAVGVVKSNEGIGDSRPQAQEGPNLSKAHRHDKLFMGGQFRKSRLKMGERMPERIRMMEWQRCGSKGIAWP
jgi:hypothetical protein